MGYLGTMTRRAAHRMASVAMAVVLGIPFVSVGAETRIGSNRQQRIQQFERELLQESRHGQPVNQEQGGTTIWYGLGAVTVAVGLATIILLRRQRAAG